MNEETAYFEKDKTIFFLLIVPLYIKIIEIFLLFNY